MKTQKKTDPDVSRVREDRTTKVRGSKKWREHMWEKKREASIEREAMRRFKKLRNAARKVALDERVKEIMERNRKKRLKKMKDFKTPYFQKNYKSTEI